MLQWADSQKVTAPELIEYSEQLAAWEAACDAAGVDGTGVGSGGASAGGGTYNALLNNKNHSTSTNRPRYGTHTNSNDLEDTDEYDPLFDPSTARADGIFNGNPPLLAHTLLDAEHVPVGIAKVSASNLQLSRATQRLLRELVGSIETIKLRHKWQQMNRRGGGAAGTASPGSPLSPQSTAGLFYVLLFIIFLSILLFIAILK